jgi:SAM-dependent methyltransferase
MRAISAALLAGPLAERRGGERPRLLDAGCGTGGNLPHLARLGTAVGLDLSADALRFCRQRGVPAARGSLLQLPFGAESFDVVTSFDVLYHSWITDDRAAVAELARVLRPGGLFLVRVPALKMLWGGHDIEVQSRHRYTTGEVRALLEAAGLDVLRLTYVNSFLFPLLLLRRTLDRLTGHAGSDVGFLPGPIEWTFRRLLGLEAGLVGRGLRLPVGASVMAVARKRASSEPEAGRR